MRRVDDGDDEIGARLAQGCLPSRAPVSTSSAKVMSPVVARIRRVLRREAVEADLDALDLDDLLVDGVGRLARRPASRTFEVTIGNFASPMRARKISGPKSNSWLPGIITSTPMWFRMSMTCAPLSMPESSEGEMRVAGMHEEGRPFGALAP